MRIILSLALVVGVSACASTDSEPMQTVAAPEIKHTTTCVDRDPAGRHIYVPC